MSKRKKLIISIVLFLSLSGLILTFFMRQLYIAPIIMYHSVNPHAAAQNRLSVSVRSFERQMRFLKTHRYNVLPLEDLAALIRDRKRIPPKTIAITFDDGYRDVYLYAFPVLKKYNLPATLFLIINEIGRPQNDRLSWDEVKVMRDSGIIFFGSHAMGPEPLVKINSEEGLKREIFASKKTLEEKLGRRVVMFSYPEGMFNAKIKQLVRDAGYRVAVATSPGRRFPNDDPFVLKRLRISSTSDSLLVFWVETSGYYTAMREYQRQRKQR